MLQGRCSRTSKQTRCYQAQELDFEMQQRNGALMVKEAQHSALESLAVQLTSDPSLTVPAPQRCDHIATAYEYQDYQGDNRELFN